MGCLAHGCRRHYVRAHPRAVTRWLRLRRCDRAHEHLVLHLIIGFDECLSEMIRADRTGATLREAGFASIAAASYGTGDIRG